MEESKEDPKETKNPIKAPNLSNFHAITEDKGIQKQEETKGDPKSSLGETKDMVGIILKGMFEDGEVFKEEKSVLTLQIGTENLRGFDIALTTMRKGEISTFRMSPEYAYGDEGHPPKIPPHAILFYTIRVIDIYKPRVEPTEMASEERYALALEYKNYGNNWFKGKDFEIAMYYYKEGMSFLEGSFEKEMTPEMIKLRGIIQLNLCVVLNSLEGRETEALLYLSILISRVPKEEEPPAKALYFRGITQHKLNMLPEALKDLKHAYKLAPTDALVRSSYLKVKKEHDKKIQEEKSAFKGFFKNTDLYEEKKFYTGTYLPDYNPNAVTVFLSIQVGNLAPELLVIELFNDLVPKTSENFRVLCTGERGSELSLKGNIFHRVVSGSMIQGGDIINRDGTGGVSIYGGEFEDESFEVPHKCMGLLTMANKGPNTNSSQFYILMTESGHMDGHHVCFGRVIQGLQFVEKLKDVKVGAKERPRISVKIVDCGEYTDYVEPEMKVYEPFLKPY